MHQLYVKSTFLNGPLDEEACVVQFLVLRFWINMRKVLRLRKALYGFKPAPCAWNKRIDNFLSQIGFVKLTSNHRVYFKVLKVVIGTNC